MEIAEALQKVSAVSSQAGISFDEMAAMITVVSSVTRQSAETIGQAFSRKSWTRWGIIHNPQMKIISN